MEQNHLREAIMDRSHTKGFFSYLHKYLEGFERSFTMKHSPPFTQKVFSFSAHFTRWLVPVVDVDVAGEKKKKWTGLHFFPSSPQTFILNSLRRKSLYKV